MKTSKHDILFVFISIEHDKEIMANLWFGADFKYFQLPVQSQIQQEYIPLLVCI